MTALTGNNHVVVVPIRSGIGLRLEANLGWLKFTDSPIGTSSNKQSMLLLMSALGQERTFCGQAPKSALPPKADIVGRNGDVRYVP